MNNYPEKSKRRIFAKYILRKFEALLNSATEVANAYLDMEGGAFLLAWTGELIQGLEALGSFCSTFLTVQNLCSAVGVELQWTTYDEIERAA